VPDESASMKVQERGGHAREDDMLFVEHGTRARAALAVGALALASVLMPGVARAADDKTYVMKITTPTLNDAPHQLAKNYAAAVERDSGGRIKAEVYPASQLGPIPRQIEGVQFGAIQCAVIPPDFFVGVDERFEVLAAPGLVDSLAHGQRVAADPAVLKLILGLGAEKGLHGGGLFMAAPSALIAKKPIRHLDDFKGRKIRIFASDFQSVALKRLGASPVAMTLGDVLPALQQGAIDGAIAAVTVFNAMQYHDAAKYITETNQPAIFLMLEISRKWYDSLPKDLQQVVDRDAAAESVAINPWAVDFLAKSRKAWVDKGGELISLPPDEQSAMMEGLASVGEDVSQPKPQLSAAYHIAADAAKRTR
jgi:TRAP-type C4-dicarboxylate transport system substrate-binding protein